jgi:putative transposase
MRQRALSGKRKKRFSPPGTERSTEAPYPNLARGFVPTGPDQLWVGDITYIRLRNGVVYLAVLIDAWSRKVIGYAVSTTMEVRLTLTALEAAVYSRKPNAGLIHPTDQGSQYLMATKCIDGRHAASTIASASFRSFLFVLTKGATYWGLINRTSMPISWKRRAQ